MPNLDGTLSLSEVAAKAERSHAWVKKLEKKFESNAVLLKERKEIHKQHMEEIEDTEINSKLADEVGCMDLYLLERSNLTQKYIGCLSLIMSMIGIEGSETAKNIKEGVEKFYQEKKHFYRDMFEVDKQIMDGLLEIHKYVMNVE